MEEPGRKELREAYQNRRVVGGVYAVRNTENGKTLVMSAADLKGAANRYAFAKQTGGCFHPKLQKDLARYGKEAFAFEVLEEIEKREDEPDGDFAGEVKILEELWLSKFDPSILY